MNTIHATAQQGFSSAAQAYERGRPEYPVALGHWLSTTLGVGDGTVVLDLGAGTGKFTRLLAQTGAQLLAVEPVAAMREQLQARVPQALALAGSAESLPLADASVDVLVCAQAFHWFATAQALDEMWRVLRPGGKLGLVWNVRDESCDWVAQISAILAPYQQGVPRFHSGDWRQPFAGSAFTPLQLTSLPHQQVGDAQQVIVDRFLSVSFIAALAEEEKQQVRAQLLALVASHPDLQGREQIVFPYRTEAYCAQRM